MAYDWMVEYRAEKYSQWMHITEKTFQDFRTGNTDFTCNDFVVSVCVGIP